jgi:hypothetical protein
MKESIEIAAAMTFTVVSVAAASVLMGLASAFLNLGLALSLVAWLSIRRVTLLVRLSRPPRIGSR